jgi:hypothetical protein
MSGKRSIGNCPKGGNHTSQAYVEVDRKTGKSTVYYACSKCGTRL